MPRSSRLAQCSAILPSRIRNQWVWVEAKRRPRGGKTASIAPSGLYATNGPVCRPDIVVCLGAIAARNVFGTRFKLMQQRGEWQTLPDGTRAFATVHPSWVLRQRDSESRAEAYGNFTDDLSLLLDA